MITASVFIYSVAFVVSAFITYSFVTDDKRWQTVISATITGLNLASLIFAIVKYAKQI